METVVSLLGVLQDFSPLVIVAASIVALIGFARYTAAYKWAAIYVVLTGILELITFGLSKYGIRNLHLFHLYSYLELLVLGLFFIQLFRALQWNYAVAISTIWLVTGLLLFVINTFWGEGPWAFNSVPRGIMAVFFLIFSTVYLIGTLEITGPRSIGTHWICSGLFIYFSSSFCVFIASNFTLRWSQEYATIIWGLHAIFCMVMHGMLMFGLWKVQKSEI